MQMATFEPSPTKAKSAPPPLQLADGRQAALLLLRLFELRDDARNKPMTRVRLTQPMLKRLWNRRRLPPQFVQEVADWLLVAGWVFFDAGPTFAAVRVNAVENWPRVFTKALGKDLDDVAAGTFVFSAHEHLLWGQRTLSDSEANVGDDIDANDGIDATDKTADDNE
jgi:hypothetical protein